MKLRNVKKTTMSERFNSGMGGYTCDGCDVLLWAGHQGSIHPENRIFSYSTKKEDVIKIGNCFYCKKCGENDSEYYNSKK